MLHHDLLPVAAQDELEEFFKSGIERLARRLIGIEIDQPAERISCQRDIFIRRSGYRAVLTRLQREYLHRRIEIRQSGISDAVRIVSDALSDGEYHALEVEVVAPFAALAVNAQ